MFALAHDAAHPTSSSGRCHGGVPFALADSTMAFAANAQGRLSYTTENCISFLQRVEEGDVLTATATEKRINDKNAEYTVRVEKAAFRGL